MGVFLKEVPIPSRQSKLKALILTLSQHNNAIGSNFYYILSHGKNNPPFISGIYLGHCL